MITLPPTAQAILQAIGWEDGMTPARLRNPVWVKTRRERAARHRVWAQLRAQEDDGRRMFSDAEIASWFGVSRAAVTIAGGASRVDGAAKVKRARPVRR